jgi:hypothetical protein
MTRPTASGRRDVPSVTYSFDLSPYVVLGVAPGATLEEIRAAYRARAKKHHPDHGGDDWAFRVVARCYEILCTTRVASHAGREAAPAPPRPSRPRTGPGPQPGARGDAEWFRPGMKDASIDPAWTVDVEVFLVRYEASDPSDLFFTPAGDQSLCCCLNVSWKALGEGEAPGAGGPGRRDSTPVPRLLLEAFQAMPSLTRALSSWHRAGDEQFEGWLSYPTAILAWEAFRTFHDALNRRGLAVNQWTREMIIPRGAY